MPLRAALYRAAAIGGIVAVALAAHVRVEAFGPRPRPATVMLLYVGAEDCPPCLVWQRGDGASFRASPGFARVIYREVRSPTLMDVLKDENWPADLRQYRAPLAVGAGVPLWFVIADGAIVERGFGLSQWRGVVLPRLKSLLR